ncbi:MAG: hypothetical protein ACR65T_03885 [Methylocystis sp.]|uniref:hypothetical protein n=1 Tax=Methylocystis sp. TaxID=1911079 RepID=UPI003DA58A44
MGRALSVDLGLVTGSFQFLDALFQRRVVEVGHTAFDGAVKAAQTGVCFGGASVEFGDMFAATLGAVLPPVENGGQDFGKAIRVKQAAFQMAGDEIVEFFHWNRPTLAAGVALPGGGRATVIAIAPAFAGADGHGPAAG